MIRETLPSPLTLTLSPKGRGKITGEREDNKGERKDDF